MHIRVTGIVKEVYPGNMDASVSPHTHRGLSGLLRLDRPDVWKNAYCNVPRVKEPLQNMPHSAEVIGTGSLSPEP